MSKRIQSSFRPAWWLQSPHLQTLWPVLFRPRPELNLQTERVELNDGDFIDLAWHPLANAPLVMVIHGLEGSLQSHYAQTLLQALHNSGFSSVFMHLRGCSGTPNRLANSYHSGLTQDIAQILEHLKATKRMPDALVGFSLGGNLTLKYLGETGAASGLQTAVAVSIPFQLEECACKLEQGFATVYGSYLLNNLKASYRRKFQRRPSPLEVEVKSLNTLYQFDDQITAPLNGFTDAHDYYTRSSCRPYLIRIQTPTLIIHAKDDPFMYPSTAPTEEMLSDAITLELTEQGGHVGFVGQRGLWHADYWLEKRIVEWLQHKLLLA